MFKICQVSKSDDASKNKLITDGDYIKEYEEKADEIAYFFMLHEEELNINQVVF